MKRVLFPILALALAASLALPMAAPVTALDGCSVSGYKYLCDESGECTQTGLEGWTINLTGETTAGVPVSRSTTTDSNGYYEFTGLSDGTYTVSETLRDGWVSCTTASYEITIETIGQDCQIHGGGTIVSDTNTLVTAGNVENPTYPYNAEYAWEAFNDPPDTVKSLWDSRLDYDFTPSGADWIWESYRVVNPADDETVGFQRSFYIPGSPTSGTLYITADNGYQVNLNGPQIGSQPVSGDWSTVESYNVLGALENGDNLLEITAVNQGGGTQDKNPAGLIYELSYEFDFHTNELNFCNRWLEADCSISGYKYLCDESGQCTGVGLGGWTINLTGPVSATTTTDTTGHYEFTGLPSGTYTVTETLEDGWEACTQTSYQVNLEGAENHGVVVSDTDTMVTDWNVLGKTDRYNAVYAWEPYSDTDPSVWDNGSTHVFGNGADWIWESYRVVHPIAGDVVEFERTFDIPGNPTGGTLYITCDNGYEVYVNGPFVGSAEVYDVLDTEWEDSDLTKSYVDTTNWQSVDTYDVSALLLNGTNTLVIKAANEYMGDLDDQLDGTEYSNPAGLIYELLYEFDVTATEIDFCNREVNTCPEDPGSRTLGFYKNHPCVVEQVLPITIAGEDVTTVERAIEIIKDRGTHWSRLRSQLLVTMLNAAVFGIGDCTLEYLGLEGDQTVDDIIALAEALLADSDATKDELSAMQDLLDRINNSNDDAPLPEDIAEACPPGGGPPKTPPGKGKGKGK